MKITGPTPTAAAGGARRTEASGAGFVVPTGEAPRVSAAAPPGPIASLDALMALQIAEIDPDQRRRQVRRGRAQLDGLDALAAALIGGGDVRAAAAALRSAAGQRREAAGEPELEGLLNEIDVRAAVELAKLEIAAAQKA